MTVKELKEALKDIPDDARLYYTNGEYRHDYCSVSHIEYHEQSFFVPANSLVIGRSYDY